MGARGRRPLYGVPTQAFARQRLAGYREAADEAVQIHGGAGYMWEMEVNRLYRDAKLLEIGAGTQEVRRGIVGKYLRGTQK